MPFRIGFVGAFAAATVIAWSAFRSISFAQDPQFEDPVRLRRIVIPAQRLQHEVERDQAGVLIEMARPEFETLVRRAAEAQEVLKAPPRFVKSVYNAELEGQALVGGGQWTIIHTGNRPGILALGNLNLALSKVKSAGGGAAVLGDVSAGGAGQNEPGLVVEAAGEQSFFFDWSLRGALGPGGLKFNFQVPASPVSILELKLPADHVLTVSKGDALLSGPHEAESPGKRTWRLQLTGHAETEILVRLPVDAETMPALLLTQLQNKQRITPARITTAFEFSLDVLHAAPSELTFECDPSLQPLEVSCRSAAVKSWEYVSSNPSLLKVQFRSPLQGPVQGLR